MNSRLYQDPYLIYLKILKDLQYSGECKNQRCVLVQGVTCFVTLRIGNVIQS